MIGRSCETCDWFVCAVDAVRGRCRIDGEWCDETDEACSAWVELGRLCRECFGAGCCICGWTGEGPCEGLPL